MKRFRAVLWFHKFKPWLGSVQVPGHAGIYKYINTCIYLNIHICRFICMHMSRYMGICDCGFESWYL